MVPSIGSQEVNHILEVLRTEQGLIAARIDKLATPTGKHDPDVVNIAAQISTTQAQLHSQL